MILLLAAVRTNLLWQQPLKIRGFKSKGKRIDHRRRGFQAKEKRIDPSRRGSSITSPFHHFTGILFHHFTTCCVITSPFHRATIILFHHYTITPLHHSSIKPHHYFTILPLHNHTINPLQYCVISLRVGWTLPKIKHLQDKSLYASSSDFEFLVIFIESLHISMSLAANNRGISLLCSATEPFLLYIPVLQCKSVGITDGTLRIDDPCRLLQTINIRKIKVKE